MLTRLEARVLHRGLWRGPLSGPPFKQLYSQAEIGIKSNCAIQTKQVLRTAVQEAKWGRFPMITAPLFVRLRC